MATSNTILNTFIQKDIELLDRIGVYPVSTLLHHLRKHLWHILADEQIDGIWDNIAEDIAFFRKNDKASQHFSDDEIHSGRQSVIAVTRHRIMAGLLQQDPSLAGAILGYNRHIYSITGMEIGPKAQIGVPFATDHHTLVIGETSTVGKGSFMYHGGTLGATSRDSEVMGRHPHVGDRVWMGLNVSILGQSILKWGIQKKGRDFNTNIAANVTIVDSILESFVSVDEWVSIGSVRIPANHHVKQKLPDGSYRMVDKESKREFIKQLPRLTLEDLEGEYISMK